MIKLLIKIFSGILTLAILGGITFFAVISYISKDLPQINSLSDYSPAISSKIYDRNGKLLLDIGSEKRTVIPISEIPKNIIDCFVSAEDDNFYNHSGIDYAGIARAAVANIKAGRVVQGGSTITQQVAKSLLLSSERSFTRKLKDLLLARKIEEKFTKEEILHLYLNQMYLGGGYYGIVEAFRGYFGKELNEVTVAECALTAGLLVAPGKYSPYVKPAQAKMRQEYVLGRLRERNIITEEEYQKAKNETIKILNRKIGEIEGGHFTDWILQQLFEGIGKEEFLRGGYEVITTLDLDLHKKAESELRQGLSEIDKFQGYKGSLSFVAEDAIESEIAKEISENIKAHEEFFFFKPEGINESPFSFDPDRIKNLVAARSEFLNTSSKDIARYSYKGNDEESDLHFKNKNIKYKENENYKAIVLKVSDELKIIYVDVLGHTGIIPIDYFKWVHKREITTDPIYHSEFKYPSRIFKTGDVIEVNILNESVTIGRYLEKTLKDKFKKKEIYKDLNSQKYVLTALTQLPEVEGAVVSVSARSGEILALVGGRDFNISKFNRAIQSKRQPGSAVKPFIYAAALENGYNPSTILLDSPQALGGVDDTLSWKPRNYDGKFLGTVTFRKALETSRNIPTIKLVQEIGVQYMTEFLKRLKIETELPQDLSISLGSFGISLLDLVSAYSIFANGGNIHQYKSILKIKNRFGEEVNLKVAENKEAIPEDGFEIEDTQNNKKEEEKKILTVEEKPEKINPFTVNLKDNYVYDRRLAYLMTNLLKGIVSHGTGQGAKDLSPNIGGKTGTTNNYVDAWFIGFSNKVITGVWTGFDDNKTMGWPQTGSKAALPIWKGVMEYALKKYGDYDFYVPSGIINVLINRDSGKPSKQKDTFPFLESFVEGFGPESLMESTQNAQNIEDAILDSGDYYSNQ